VILALLLALTGGRVYAARFEARNAQVAVWRYAAAGERSGPPVVIFGELGFDNSTVAPLAKALQQRGREVFTPDWRGTGQSTPGPDTEGLEAIFLGDARAALESALRETGAPCAQLIGLGLGGAAVWMLADKACAIVAINVPVRWETPNEAVKLLRGAWPDVLSQHFGNRDAGELILGVPARERHGVGHVTPALTHDVAEWMQGGPLAQRISAAVDKVKTPLLVVSSPRDNLVHPEHALALRQPHDTIVLSRIEGYAREETHLPVPRALFPEVAAWLASH
jgi:pimeloyl-ACP methyl ester carboxylesterase